MSERPLPLSGLRVVDCTVERGELTAVSSATSVPTS